MPVTAYAVPTDVTAYMGVLNAPPAQFDTTELTRLIARAQDLIDAILLNYTFSVDSSGNPTDSTVIAALNKAACAQVEHWILTADEHDELGQFQQFTLEGISMSRRTDMPALRRERLCTRAWDAIRSTQMLTPWVSPT